MEAMRAKPVIETLNTAISILLIDSNYYGMQTDNDLVLNLQRVNRQLIENIIILLQILGDIFLMKFYCKREYD